MRVVATAGHVDHGKSSLVEVLTGVNPDRWDEERRRGVTIDLGFAPLTLTPDNPASPTAEISFIDVPGHVRFLRNMLAGVGAVDACLFVVAATEGWKPQSEEHLRILHLLGIRHGVIALTKSDLVDDEWLQLQALDIADRVAATFLADAPIVPVSSTTGRGLDELRAALVTLASTTPAAVNSGRVRLWIDRVFSARGSGTVVTGTLLGGSIDVDDRLDVLPADTQVRVRAIQHHGTNVTTIEPGHRVALNLSGIEHHELERGDVLVRATQWRPTTTLDASLEVLASLDHAVSRRGAHVAYIGSREVTVRVRILGDDVIEPGSTGAVRVYLDTALPLLPGDRFVLRESGRLETVGGGQVLDVAPTVRAARAAPDLSVDRVVAERGWVEVDELDALTGHRRPPTVGRWVVDPTALQSATAAIVESIGQAGALGLDISSLTDLQRAIVSTLDNVRVDNGRLIPVAATDPFADHPFVTALADGGFSPPDATGVDRRELAELVRRRLVVERDGIYFHPRTVDAAAAAAAELLASAPDGFTVAEIRDRLGVTRKFALPLLNELDGRGVTRRRGDVRIGGPRLPSR